MAYNAKATIAQIILTYQKTGSIWRTAQELGMCGQSVHERLQKAGYTHFKNRPITPAEESAIRAWYADPSFYEVGLEPLAKTLGRTKQTICRHAGKIGLTKISHKKSQRECARMSIEAKRRIKESGHPRGMLGKKHSEESLKKISKASKRNNANMTAEQKFSRTQKILKTRLARHGTLAPMVVNDKRSWKSGWRQIGEIRKYYRSRWEANYARYLEMQKQAGIIAKWEHEPQTFWFEGVRRGTTNYLPDFRVTFPDGRIEYHEVKGWMCPRSITKLRRMAKHHPDVIVVIIDGKWFSANKAVRHAIPDWEF